MAVGVVGLVVATSCAPKNSIGSVPPAHSVSGAEVALRAGMSAGPGLLWESDAEQNADLAGIQNSGARWINIDIDWNSIQGDGPNSFRWDRATDRVVLNARAHGLSILGMAAYSPPWARVAGCGELHCLPANADDYGRFLTAAAARYGSRSSNPLLRNTITTWQLWNEPNHREFAQPKPNPDLYTAMLKSAYPGIKAVDPTATVVTGGTAPAPDAPDGTDYKPETWLRDLYARGARGSFDAIAHHPYAFPVNPLEPHPWNAYTQTLVLHDIMASNGDGAKKIWGTEMGAPTGTASDVVTEAQQAQWVHDYYLGWNTTFRSFTGPLIWMELRDSGTNVADKWQNLGLLHRDRRAKPAYSAFQTVMRNGV
ncbi:MAG: beta-xylosidase [Acidimicrobiia bacterium]